MIQITPEQAKAVLESIDKASIRRISRNNEVYRIDIVMTSDEWVTLQKSVDHFALQSAAQHEPQGVPAAWRIKGKDGEYTYSTGRPYADHEAEWAEKITEPLYTPTPAPEPAEDGGEITSKVNEAITLIDTALQNAVNVLGTEICFHDGRCQALQQVRLILKEIVPHPAKHGDKVCAGAPDGWKLLPLELTDEMAEVIAEHCRCCGGIAETIYHHLLAAAPAAMEKSGEG